MIKKKEIIFPNGNRAHLVRTAAGTPAADILKKLGIEQPEALIIFMAVLTMWIPEPFAGSIIQPGDCPYCC